MYFIVFYHRCNTTLWFDSHTALAVELLAKLTSIHHKIMQIKYENQLQNYGYETYNVLWPVQCTALSILYMYVVFVWILCLCSAWVTSVYFSISFPSLLHFHIKYKIHVTRSGCQTLADHCQCYELHLCETEENFH